MARITIEDCIENVPNHFHLVQMAAIRTLAKDYECLSFTTVYQPRMRANEDIESLLLVDQAPRRNHYGLRREISHPCGLDLTRSPTDSIEIF